MQPFPAFSKEAYGAVPLRFGRGWALLVTWWQDMLCKLGVLYHHAWATLRTQAEADAIYKDGAAFRDLYKELSYRSIRQLKQCLQTVLWQDGCGGMEPQAEIACSLPALCASHAFWLNAEVPSAMHARPKALHHQLKNIKFRRPLPAKGL